MIMSLKQREIKFKPRIKLSHNMYILYLDPYRQFINEYNHCNVRKCPKWRRLQFYTSEFGTLPMVSIIGSVYIFFLVLFTWIVSFMLLGASQGGSGETTLLCASAVHSYK